MIIKQIQTIFLNFFKEILENNMKRQIPSFSNNNLTVIYNTDQYNKFFKSLPQKSSKK